MSERETLVEAGVQKLVHLETQVEQGSIKIPQFQRDFVWSVAKSASLVDSILKGFPIGALIYWRTDERLREVRNLGRLDFPEAKDGERVDYVLDGQQRLTSILAALNGLQVEKKDESALDFGSILVRMSREDAEDPIVVMTQEEVGESKAIPLAELWSRSGDAYDSCVGDDKTVRDKLSDKLRSFDIPKVTLMNADLAMATEVFSRINTGGQDLSVFEIMVAKTYSPERDFDLVEKTEEVMEELESRGFGAIEQSTLIQLVSLILAGECKGKILLGLKKDAFIDEWPKAIDSLYSAVDHIRSSLRLPISRLLPYSSMVIPFALFFRWNDKKSITNRQAALLQDFFWRAGWSKRYTAGSDAKLSQDVKIVEDIIKEKKKRYAWEDPIDADSLVDQWFSAGSAFPKTIIALLATVSPEKYNNGDLVNLQDNWMHRADSRNFHHIFPRAFLKKKGYENWEINRIVNISLVDDFLNKRVIRARAPSDYMDDFYDENENFEASMATHLIDTQYDEENMSKSAPIWSDDYDSFVKQRSEAIIAKLKSYLVED